MNSYMHSHIFFFNRCFDKNRLKAFILWTLMNFGEDKTIEIVEKLKDLGFQFATQAGTSLSLDDLKIPPSKAFLVSEAEAQVQANQQEYLRGNLTSIEGFQQLVDTWHRTSEILKHEVIQYFQSTDLLNPVYMMAFSGARGNVSQVRQLVGMRGLMADPQGQIIGFPIRSNFREGLTVTEYMISCYGARKGLVDTALRTADAGYLTRRLVDVSQHIVVRTATCGTKRGIFLKDITESGQIRLALKERIVGRVLGRDIFEKQTKTVLAKRNQEISANLAIKIAKLKKKILVRSPLTCSSKHGVCQLCYGWSLSHGHLVTLGEAVGIIAAQSIGEPGTQLTMRTFHTGGVFSGDVLDEVRAPHSGSILFLNPIQGVLIRTSHGRIAFLTKLSGEMILTSPENKKTQFAVEKSTILFVRTGEQVTTSQLLAESSSLGNQTNERVEARKTVFSEITGQAYFVNMILGKKIGKYGDMTQISRNLGSIWILSAKKSKVSNVLKIFKNGTHLFNENSIISRIHPISNNFNLFNSKKLALNPLSVFMNRRIESQKKEWLSKGKNPSEIALNKLLARDNMSFENQKSFSFDKTNKQYYSLYFENVHYKENCGYFISLKKRRSFKLFQNIRKGETEIFFFKMNSVIKNTVIQKPKPISVKKPQFEKIETENKENRFFHFIKKRKQNETSFLNNELKNQDFLSIKQNLKTNRTLLKSHFSILWFQDFYKVRTSGFTYINPYFLNLILYRGILYFLQQEIYGVKSYFLPNLFFKKRIEKKISSHFVEKRQDIKILETPFFNKVNFENKTLFYNSGKTTLFYQFNFQGKKKAISFNSSGFINFYFSKFTNFKNKTNVKEIQTQNLRTKKQLIRKNPQVQKTKNNHFIQLLKIQPKLPFESIKILNLDQCNERQLNVELKGGWVYFPENKSKNLNIFSNLNKIKKQLFLDDLFFSYSPFEVEPIQSQHFNYFLKKNEFTIWQNLILYKIKTNIAISYEIFEKRIAISDRIFRLENESIALQSEESIKDGIENALFCQILQEEIKIKKIFESKINTPHLLYYLRELLSCPFNWVKDEKLINQHNIENWKAYLKNKDFSLLKYYKIKTQIFSNSKNRFWSLKTEFETDNKLSFDFVKRKRIQQIKLKQSSSGNKNLNKNAKFIFLIRQMKSSTFLEKENQKKKFYTLNKNHPQGFLTNPKKEKEKVDNFFYNKFKKLKEIKSEYFDKLSFTRKKNKQNISILLPKKEQNNYDFKPFIIGKRYHKNFIHTHSYLLKIEILNLNSEKTVNYSFEFDQKFSAMSDEIFSIGSNVDSTNYGIKKKKNFQPILNFAHFNTKIKNEKEEFENRTIRSREDMSEEPVSEIPVFKTLNGEFFYKKSQKDGLILTKDDQISFSIENNEIKVSIGQLINYGEEIATNIGVIQSGQVIGIEFNQITLRKAQAVLFYSQGISHVEQNQWVEKNAPLLTLSYQKLVTGDIVQGIPKIEQFFEAPSTKEGEPLPDSLQIKLKKSFHFYKKQYSLPKAVRKSLQEIQEILVEGIQKVYLSQGVLIADKHLEVIIRQMTSKGKILDAGDTGLLRGEFVNLNRIESVNLSTYGQKAQYEPSVLGITQASLDSESFISAASFQETTRVLSRDTIIGKTDFLRGLKERVVLGDLIQAGTGLDDNIIYGLLMSYTSINSNNM